MRKENVKYVIFITVFLFLSAFIFQIAKVSGNSMNPAFSQEELVVIDKVTYKAKNPERFDVIIFETKDNEKLIKRIIGLPNETVRIDENGCIYINGNVLKENYGKEKITFTGLAKKKIHLKDDEYFVLGDNRNYSMDSRYKEIGNIKEKDIIGKVGKVK